MKRKKKIIIPALVLISIIAINFVLFSGQTPQNQPGISVNTTPGFWGLLFKTTLLLGFIIIIIYGVLYFLRRFVYRTHYNRSHSIEILEIVPLMAKKSMCIVKVVDRILVLGISENGINTLTEIDDLERQRLWESKFQPASGKNTANFSQQLQNILGVKRK